MLTLKPQDYPPALQLLPPTPKQIFYIGADPREWLSGPRLAVVGSRKHSAYGSEVTKYIVRQLARAEVTIISGLALGIDGIVHRSALQAGGRTVAVLPGSLDTIYPKSHRGLADEILSSGGSLISEQPPGYEVYKPSFIARNRLIAGFSEGVLITEAASGSGSLHTASFGLDAGLNVMAVPGSVFSPLSSGTNKLIKVGAQLVSNGEEVLNIMGYKSKTAKSNKTGQKFSEIENQILALVGSGISQDELAEKLHLKAEELASLLTILEIRGHLKPQGSGLWVAI